MAVVDGLPGECRKASLFTLMDPAPALLLCLCAGSVIVVCGAVFGQSYLVLAKHSRSVETDVVGALAAWDGQHYVHIAEEGYSYNPEQMSNVAFFPAYPLAGRIIAGVTGWRVDFSLL